MADFDVAAASSSRKRMADGIFKPFEGLVTPLDARISASPERVGASRGHGRTASNASAASSGRSIGDMSIDLKRNLSRAAQKLRPDNFTDEAGSPASRASPSTSSISTLPGQHLHQRSASPRLTVAPHAAASSNLSPIDGQPRSTALQDLSYDRLWPPQKTAQPPSGSPLHASATPSHGAVPSLAPPAPIQPAAASASSSRPISSSQPNPRRNSNPSFRPATLTHSHSASPRTPTVSQREQEAIAVDSLLSMKSSPGPSASLQHGYSPAPTPRSAASPAPATSTSAANSTSNSTSILTTQPPPPPPGRHALPSAPRKPLPGSAGAHRATNSFSHPAAPRSQQGGSGAGAGASASGSRKVGFHGSPGGVSDMDLDESPRTAPSVSSPYAAGRRRVNGGATGYPNGASARAPPLPLPGGLTALMPVVPDLTDAEIHRRIQAESDSSDDDIEIPRPRAVVPSN